MFRQLLPKLCCLVVLHGSRYLQSILEQLVHPRHLGADTEIDGAVTDLDDEAAVDLGVDLLQMRALVWKPHV
jgi:hypothetical protein